ncbi:MAG: hypothetical protein NVS4B10_15300 [Myxococcales bacterium]
MPGAAGGGSEGFPAAPDVPAAGAAVGADPAAGADAAEEPPAGAAASVAGFATGFFFAAFFDGEGACACAWAAAETSRQEAAIAARRRMR